MSIGGSDSSAGAGVQADLKTFTELGCHGLTVISSITAQNTSQVSKIEHVKNQMIYEQIRILKADLPILATKTGMLGTADIIKTVAKAVDHFSLKNLIVDPVMVATGGDSLINKTAIEAVKKKLLPHAYLITPNIFEAEVFTDMKINSLDKMEKAAEKIQKMGPQYVLVKGGHLILGDHSIDVMQTPKGIRYFQGKYIPKEKIRGTGCTLSAAIVAYLALGNHLLSAMEKSKKLISKRIKKSYQLKKGVWILN